LQAPRHEPPAIRSSVPSNQPELLVILPGFWYCMTTAGNPMRRSGVKRYAKTVLFGLLVLSVSLPSFAADDGMKWSGRIGAGILVMDKADNLWGNGHRQIRSLNQSPRSATIFLPLPLFDLKYSRTEQGTGGGTRTQFYFNTGISEPGSLNLGMRKGLEIGDIDAYLFYSLVSRAWENPYVLYRERTGASEYGGRITWANIFKSKFSLSYRVGAYNVEHDLIGDLNRDLRRDGFSHSATASYFFQLPAGFGLVPSVTFEKGIFEGKSNSYNAFGGALALVYGTGNLSVTARLNANQTDFDRRHPIFNKTRNEKSYGITLMANIQEPFGWKKWFLSAAASGQTTDANIRFFDRRSTIGILSAGYNF
jgi:hypothetical protein